MNPDDQVEALSPFHAGEVELQRSVGVAERMDAFGRRVIRDFMPDQHRDFYAQLPFIVAATVDPDGDVWATVLAGGPDFMHSPDPQSLRIDLPLELEDPATTGIADGHAIGLLGIDLNTRRRNRMNGNLSESSASGFTVEVEHSFGNCPQYIQLRNWYPADPVVAGVANAEYLAALDPAAREMISSADTFFVASYLDLPDGRRQVDVSHRGGKPGFVRVADDGLLTVPDFAGNLHFNTLGNFLLNPRAGLVFVNFQNGDVLQLVGRAELILDSPEIAAFQGAERLWTFKPEKCVRRRGSLPLRFELVDWSPNSLMTGDWEDVAQRRRADQLKSQWRPFRITKIVEESSVIRSFHLEPADDAGLTPNEAGQHLPIRVQPDESGSPVIRAYTISSAASDGSYRLSVKREGLVSSFLHDTIETGSIIEARAPAGCFTIDALERRPAVLLAAGVGITPILAMLRHVIFEGIRTRRIRPTTVFYAARNKTERAFDAELTQLASQAQGAVRIIRLLEDPSMASQGQDFDAVGRIDAKLLRRTLGFDDYDFLMCGPPPFMQALYDGLRDLNIADDRIHAEAFGPASLRRRVDLLTSESLVPPSTVPVPVVFAGSGKEARWAPDSGTLLDLAEARGLTPEFSCRGGSCGTCKSRIIAGAVSYAFPPAFKTKADEALICCAVPATPTPDGDRLILDI